MGTATTAFNHGRRKPQQKPVPKGCLAVKVGEADGEQQRFVVPVIWFNHPLFVQLLKEAEDEYGFEQRGTITIPCNVHHFRTIISHIIHQNHNQNSRCFRVWAG
ncbi:putative small auxin-up RNA [Helianthus anomalus]